MKTLVVIARSMAPFPAIGQTFEVGPGGVQVYPHGGGVVAAGSYEQPVCIRESSAYWARATAPRYREMCGGGGRVTIILIIGTRIIRTPKSMAREAGRQDGHGRSQTVARSDKPTTRPTRARTIGRRRNDARRQTRARRGERHRRRSCHGVAFRTAVACPSSRRTPRTDRREATGQTPRARRLRGDETPARLNCQLPSPFAADCFGLAVAVQHDALREIVMLVRHCGTRASTLSAWAGGSTRWAQKTRTNGCSTGVRPSSAVIHLFRQQPSRVA